MRTIDQLMNDADETFGQIELPEGMDWEALDAATPGDITEDEEMDEEVMSDMANAEVSEDWAARLTAALSADLQPLGAALAGALQAGDAAAFQAAMKKISERMPEFLESHEMADLLADEFVNALSQPDPEP